MTFYELHKTRVLFSFWVLCLQNILNFYKMLIISQGSLRLTLRNFHIMPWTKQATLIYKLLCTSLFRLWYFSQRNIRKVFFSSLYAVFLRALLYWPESLQTAVSTICHSLHCWGTKLQFLLLKSDEFLWKEGQLFIISLRNQFLTGGGSRHYMPLYSTLHAKLSSLKGRQH